jgi:hypothetical protein
MHIVACSLNPLGLFLPCMPTHVTLSRQMQSRPTASPAAVAAAGQEAAAAATTAKMLLDLWLQVRQGMHLQEQPASGEWWPLWEASS